MRSIVQTLSSIKADDFPGRVILQATKGFQFMTSLVRRGRAGMSAVEKGVVMAVSGLAASAIANAYLASKAEAENQPIGKFVDVDGVRLHYTEMGTGNPVVFLHGNGSMIQDFSSSGVLDMTAQSFRVVAFDRPGFGFSERPSDREWTPAAQARLFQRAFAQLSIVNPVLVAHSWGTLVALRFAVDFPTAVKQLVLMSGYYFPTQRADTLLSTPGSLPVIGPIIQHTVGPLVGRLFAKRAIEQMFDPLPVSASFERAYSTELAM
ncbi:MAG: alpha/beta fold hydrolase, partial [Halobacteriota archaeon]